MKNLYKTTWIVIGVLSLTLITAKAQIIITEVDAQGSSTSQYGADWFELTNEGSLAVSIAGWKMDDNSDSYSDAVSLTGVSSIAAGQSVVFLEDTGNSKLGLTDAQLGAKFTQAWFGTAVPAGFTLGYYGGSGVGLSSTADAVNIFNTTQTQVTGVQFNASDPNGATFDNSLAKLGGTLNSDPTISTFSVAGVQGAFDSNTSDEIGSPGAVPEPSSLTLLLGSLGLLGLAFRRKLITAS